MKILAATDGSDFSRNAIEKACEMLADGADNQIRILAVFEADAYTGTEAFAVSAEYLREMEKSQREQADKFVEEAAETVRDRFAESHAQVTTKVVKGSPGRAIVEEAEEWGADLIVVGSHGYGFWGRALLGSVSDKVIHQAHCSVLIIREKPEVDDGVER